MKQHPHLTLTHRPSLIYNLKPRFQFPSKARIRKYQGQPFTTYFSQIHGSQFQTSHVVMEMACVLLPQLRKHHSCCSISGYVWGETPHPAWVQVSPVATRPVQSQELPAACDVSSGHHTRPRASVSTFPAGSDEATD